jgi:hypothetical protein
MVCTAISFIGLAVSLVVVAAIMPTDHKKVASEHDDNGHEKGNALTEPKEWQQKEQQ